MGIVLIVVLSVAVSFLGYVSQVGIAWLVLVATLLVAVRLERARIRHERPFYFNSEISGFRALYLSLWSDVIAIFKAAVAGFFAFLFFSRSIAPKSVARLESTTVALFVCVLVFAVILLRLKRGNERNVIRLGYFLLVLPMGISYALIEPYVPTSLIPFPKQSNEWWPWLPGGSGPNCLDIKGAADPNHLAECYFQLSDVVDSVFEGVLHGLGIPDAVVAVIAISGSTNLAMGFVLAPMTVAIVWLATRFEKS